jgi:polyphosphate kinase
MGRTRRLRTLLQSPFTLHKSMLEFIEREIAAAEAGQPARILAKMNSLIEPKIIQALYRASRAGVRVDLIVRGICALRPGVKGVSENIRVRSIVDRFLEHTRVVRFENDGQPELWIGSADWMPRNLSGRVEVMCRVRAPAVIQRLEEAIDVYRRDDVKARELAADGSYRRSDGAHGVRAQEWLIQRANQTLPS